jgi:hypothetical protein
MIYCDTQRVTEKKRRKNLPASILERFVSQLVTDKPLWKDSNLRYFLLSQENTPTWILAELANVDLEGLRAEKQISDNLDITEDFEESGTSDINPIPKF